jgi:hypothetical protein
MPVKKNYNKLLFSISFVHFKERNNNSSTTTTKPRPPSPGYSKDFEYLIRRELDIDHAPSTFNRSNISYLFSMKQ